MVGVKVFVGNLSFKTTEAELAEAFKPAGKIVNAHIITTPSNRSKGYGFVEFETKPEAEKAVELLNKKEIGGRPINVELARPQEETATTTATTTTATTTNNNAPRQPRAPRPRREGGAPAKTTGGRFQKKGGERRERVNNNNNSGNGKAEVSENVDRAVRRRPRRYQQRRAEEEQTPEDKTPSKTMLFVANLAWKVTDESFNDFLKKEGIKFKSANVVITRNGRSRGYGFVSCDTTDDQNKAMEILNKRELDGRPLNVKVANASSETPRTPAPATTAPATTTATATTTPAPAPEAKKN